MINNNDAEISILQARRIFKYEKFIFKRPTYAVPSTRRGLRNNGDVTYVLPKENILKKPVNKNTHTQTM